MILKAIFYVQHFCSFGAMLFILNLPIKRTPLLLAFFNMLEHVRYEPFSLIKLQIWKIFYVIWLNFVYCLTFTSLKPDSSR